jgi:hypothetical protein
LFKFQTCRIFVFNGEYLTVLKWNRHAAALALFATALPLQSAYAQEAASTTQVSVGNSVYDPDGELVGTVDSVNDSGAILNVDGKKVGLPLNAFVKGDKGLLIGAKAAELKASVEKQEAEAAAKLQAALVVGAEVRSVDGASVIATVKSIDGDAVILSSPDGDVGLPKSAFFMPAHGLSTAFTAEQFKQGVAQAKAAAAPAQ